jgi:diguanylate cyclase (GGDEF)-like protein
MAEPTGSLLLRTPWRREGLEQIFCHDLLNLVEGLDGIAANLRKGRTSVGAAAGQLQDLGRQMAETIQSQRTLVGAGDGRLVARVREVSASELLEKVRRVFNSHWLAEGRALDLDPGPPGSFRTDPALLARVLVNLVKNALEATPPGGKVKVWQERGEGRRCFMVENPGVIDQEVADLIFRETFSTKGCRGRGLGTQGAKLLGEHLLGGKIGFTSADGSTRFSLWIPDPVRSGVHLHPDGNPGGTPALEPCSQDGNTLLVIDDSLTVRRMLDDMLSPRHRVLLAATATEGLALAAEQAPDLILLDVRLPDLDGYEVCARLKGDACTRGIPVLFLTALSGEADEMRALEAGAIDFIPKPISPAVLCARVRNHLEMKRNQDRLRYLSLLDGLTGIGNRRRFDQFLEQEWQRCTRSGQPLSLVMGDVDFFKAYNDHYGHGKGDECLRAVAGVFARALRRPGDLAARYGGEEFACVLPDTGREGARNVADQIMALMADLDLPHAHSSVAGRVTVSVGVATSQPLPGHDLQALVLEADRHLYRAKHNGRNRIEGV